MIPFNQKYAVTPISEKSEDYNTYDTYHLRKQSNANSSGNRDPCS